MRFNYGERNTIRALEEAEFWKHQEGEHTDVIQEITPDLEEEYVNRLNEYKEVFNSTESRIIQYIETVISSNNVIRPDMLDKIMKLIDLTIKQSQVFVTFLGNLIKESEAVMNNPMAVVVINHIRRESEYYIGVITAFLNSSYMMENDFLPFYSNKF